MTNSENQKRKGPVRQLFGSIWGAITWLRRALANVIFIIIIVAILALIGQSRTDVLPQDFALRLAPSGVLVDQRQALDAFAALTADESAEQSETLVADVIRAINLAATDEQVSHLVLDLNSLRGGGVSKLYEIGQALEQFKASGKSITAVSDHYNQDQYFLASYADEVYLHDMGFVLLTGFASYHQYFKDALDKLAVNMHVFKVGKYKDAVEPYTRNGMSEASREHNRLWLNTLWQAYRHNIEIQRELPSGAIDDIISRSSELLQQAEGDTALMAQQAGLIDTVASRQEISNTLIQRFGLDTQTDQYKHVNWSRYLQHRRDIPLPGADYVGLITARGAIHSGDHPPGVVGSETLVQLLRQARDDQDIKALVVRVDSPGGSAFASEVIRAELEATRNAGIPVVISMGSVAASGGYWISTGGDEIWALPTTITGSIGVFSIMPTLEQSLAKLGVYTDGIATSELAGSLDPTRALSEPAAAALQMGVDSIYQRFLQTVADARDLTVEQVHEIAQGRVWSGERAKELGLVDQLGTLQEATAAAAAMAELTQWKTKEITPPLTPMEQLIMQLANSGVSLPGDWQSSLGALTTLNPLGGGLGKRGQEALTELFGDDSGDVQARCLSCSLISRPSR
ncbi:signal peptide peptidase SppA [Gilvimarinus agarilyticus]|uniref:signal peptide peptidase SppA n=1 Tax=Gilvimarinus agarilyticus TaxID=679259 RepID=UPI000695CE7A|nr:signal peptide peptidase SppA [Gilvimarinus agarilyticus]